MKINVLFKKAVTLRKRGSSFKQIHELLGIAKSTCYVWLKDVKLSELGLQKLKARGEKGRQKGWQTNHNKVLVRNAQTNKKVISSLAKISLKREEKKLICSILYWAEGGKTENGVKFTNSDPAMIKVFLSFFRKGFNLKESKFRASLHLHGYHNQRIQKKFWSGVTKIPLNKIGLYLKPNSGKNIRTGYPGCISIRYNDVTIVEEIRAYYKNFAKKYGEFV